MPPLLLLPSSSRIGEYTSVSPQEHFHFWSLEQNLGSCPSGDLSSATLTEGRTWLNCPPMCHLTKFDTPDTDRKLSQAIRVFGRLIKYLIAIQLDRYQPHATWSDGYICQKRRCITQLTHEVCSVVVQANQTSPTTTRWWTWQNSKQEDVHNEPLLRFDKIWSTWSRTITFQKIILLASLKAL